MASASHLTDLHRTAQARISAWTAAQLLLLWPTLDPANLDESTGRWLLAASTVIEQARTASATVADAYLRQIRAIEVPGLSAPPPMPAAAAAPIEAIQTSLIVTGPVSIKAATTVGTPLAQAATTASYRVAAAGSRHALNGGRQLIVAAIDTDPKAIGFRRVTSPGACAFCVRIAGYSAGNPALRGEFQCHDGCHCQPQPIYA